MVDSGGYSSASSTPQFHFYVCHPLTRRQCRQFSEKYHKTYFIPFLFKLILVYPLTNKPLLYNTLPHMESAEQRIEYISFLNTRNQLIQFISMNEIYTFHSAEV